jgi:hypothetical protein
VSASVNTTSLIAEGDIPCADSNTICARRHVTTEPEVRRTIRNSRWPSSFVISRNNTLAAKSAPSRRDDPGRRSSTATASSPVMSTGKRCRAHH